MSVIHGRENRWAEAYDPARMRLGGLGKLAKEGLSNATRYASYLGPGDPSGSLHEMSAVCPHLKCIVQWNSLESSWDCPCHGSRIDARGKVLHGPAVSDLEPEPSDGEEE